MNQNAFQRELKAAADAFKQSEAEGVVRSAAERAATEALRNFMCICPDHDWVEHGRTAGLAWRAFVEAAVGGNDG